MAGPRSFAAVIDQDSVVLIEYTQEKSGFRLVGISEHAERFLSAEAAAGAVANLLADLKAKNASVSIVLQHFGSFFHTVVVPPTTDDNLRLLIQREVQRSFNIADPALAFSSGSTIERRDASRAGGQLPRQVFIAGAPRSVVYGIQATLQKARARVACLTVIPEVVRHLYDTLDGSTEATAVLICLHNGPHVAYFVNGALELAIEPPLALEGESPLDTTAIIDQLERGAIFLRQQARGTVATRLLLAAKTAEFENLASTIEARTGMRVGILGEGVGSPEAVVAMGAVIAARGSDSLDLVPRPPSFDEQLKTAMRGPGLWVSGLLTAAAVAALWAGSQVFAVQRAHGDIVRLQGQVERALPALASARESAQGRERIASIRATLRTAGVEKAAAADLLATIARATQPGTQLDSIQVLRTDQGLATRLFCRASARTGPAAMSAATNFYRHFQARPSLKKLNFQSSYAARPVAGGPVATATASGSENLHFVVSFVAPAGEE